MEKDVSTEPKHRITAEEYLAIERKSETKSEYLNGEMFAMAGVTRQHSTILVNLITELNIQFKGKNCEVHGPDLRVKVSPTGLYTYPDVIAICGEPKFEDKHLDTMLNPHVLIEVLSESSESYDRGKKFAHYRTIDSLREYFLVSQSEPRLECFCRKDDGSWTYNDETNLNRSMPLVSIDCFLLLSNVYDRVDFERGGLGRQDRPTVS